MRSILFLLLALIAAAPVVAQINSTADSFTGIYAFELNVESNMSGTYFVEAFANDEDAPGAGDFLALDIYICYMNCNTGKVDCNKLPAYSGGVGTPEHMAVSSVDDAMAGELTAQQVDDLNYPPTGYKVYLSAKWWHAYYGIYWTSWDPDTTDVSHSGYHDDDDNAATEW